MKFSFSEEEKVSLILVHKKKCMCYESIISRVTDYKRIWKNENKLVCHNKKKVQNVQWIIFKELIEKVALNPK